MDPHLARWVEEAARLFEAGGVPRMAGRALAFLLVADPPEPTAKEVAQALGVDLNAFVFGRAPVIALDMRGETG